MKLLKISREIKLNKFNQGLGHRHPSQTQGYQGLTVECPCKEWDYLGLQDLKALLLAMKIFYILVNSLKLAQKDQRPQPSGEEIHWVICP